MQTENPDIMIAVISCFYPPSSMESSLFNLDLFASRANARLPDYYSWKPDPYTKTVDTFTVFWSQDQLYLFLPFNLIGRALTKIQTDSVKYACLVAPVWPAQVWYPQVLQVLVKYPVLLPMVLNPDQCSYPIELEEQMCLATWPIFGKPMLYRVLFLQFWRANTHSAYNSAWSTWCGWYNQRQIHPFSASLEEKMDQFDLELQYHSLNILCSVISTSHSKVDNHNVGNHPLVSRLLKGMFNAKPPGP